MTDKGIEATKQKADALVASYGRFSIISQYEVAIEHLAEIWALTPLEVQILKPKNASFASSAVRSAGTVLKKSVAFSSKSASAFKVKEFATQAKKAKSATQAADLAKDSIADISSLAKKASQVGISFVKRNPVALAVTGVGSAAASFGLGNSMLTALKAFNEECYNLRNTGP